MHYHRVSSSSPTLRGDSRLNRLNDLTYRDWMLFSKSFFLYEGDQSLVDGMLGFFTKKIGSRSLVIGADGFRQFPAFRNVTHIKVEGMSGSLSSALHTSGVHDFILIDMRGLLWKDFVIGGEFFTNLRQTLHDDCYCCLLVEEPPKGFPVAVAQASRSHMRLCEEKVCLVERTGQVVYCLIMQSCDDIRHPIVSTGMRTASYPGYAPTWIIPKPPPRTKDELFHPATFPEVLIEHLIDTFTDEGDNVLDPMAGTGSAVIAALRTGRNGYGIDLSKEFVRISREKIGQEAVLPEIAKSPSPIKVTSIRRRPFAPLASVSLRSEALSW